MHKPLLIQYFLHILLACSLQIHFPLLHAQEISVRPIPMLDKLPVKAIHRIFQDSEGYIWYGTFDGLCRYDGYDIKVYRSDLSNPNLLASNYITYIADNIAAAVDRRSKEDGEMGFIKDQPLESVFNILNGNQERKLYRPMMLDINGDMNCPVSRKVPYAEGFYSGVKEKIKNCLLEFQWNDAYVNAILEILEATTTFVPSSTSTNELADISLYDHVIDSD